MSKSLYDPIREQLMVALQFTVFTEERGREETLEELLAFKDFFNYMSRQIEVYLTYEILRTERNG